MNCRQASIVMVGLGPTIHLSTCSGACGAIGPRGKREDDTVGGAAHVPAVIPAKRGPRRSSKADSPIPAREPGPRVECGSQPSCGPGSRVSLRSPGMTAVGHTSASATNRLYPNASLLFFTFSASTYTCPPISRNFLLISAMPASGSMTVVSCASSTPASFSFAA
jgi:hypothetical protein